ncbi:MAG: GNAT family N-acetyltransferase [Clostridia bacterium]|nr:GNAT family N-acetyltransferase [Clostridia bacterium]
MMDKIPDLNLFMMCERPVVRAFRPIPDGYHVRCLRPSELDIWKDIHFDQPNETTRKYMNEFYERVYAPKEEDFFTACKVLCDKDENIIGTCFSWPAYGQISTIQWFRIKKEYEGRGLGRALLTYVMIGLSGFELPVYLHTQPESYRAIKLYTDFGFSLLKGGKVGTRENELEKALPYLEKAMTKEAFDSLRFAETPDELLSAAASSDYSQF